MSPPVGGLRQEDGSGSGGYAKEMSKEWFAAAERMLGNEVKDMDVVVGTALIPGRPAPRLITEVCTCRRSFFVPLPREVFRRWDVNDAHCSP